MTVTRLTSTQKAVTARSQVPRLKWSQRTVTRQEGEKRRKIQIARARMWVARWLLRLADIDSRTGCTILNTAHR